MDTNASFKIIERYGGETRVKFVPGLSSPFHFTIRFKGNNEVKSKEQWVA